MRNHAFRAAFVSLALSAAGCASYFGHDDPVAREVRADVARSERMSAESLTMSRLSAMERSLRDYIKSTGRVPERLDSLIPEYLAEIPEVTLGIRGHRDTSEVVYYPPNTIQNNGINGTAIRDTGAWGYAYNGERAIIFVDCMHPSMRGGPWYGVVTGLRLEVAP